jgi:xylulokinase
MYLGLDLGTTNVKAIVVDAAGRIAAEGSAPVDRFYTPEGGVEQDIDAIWQATCAAVRKAGAAVDPGEIRALGVSSQGAALQLLDADQRPVGRVISWLDGRGRPFDHELTAELGEEFFARHLGRTPCTMTPGQILRLRAESPQLVGPTTRLGWVGDVIVGRLCGRRAHDATSLSIAMLYNPSLDRADPEILKRLGLGDDQLPDLLPATTPAGGLTASAAERTGLRAGIPVSAAIHDQYAAVLGAGSVHEGDACLGTGTAWVVTANTGEEKVSGTFCRNGPKSASHKRCLTPLLPPPLPFFPGTFVCRHPVAGLFGQMLPLTNGGAAIDWVLNITGQARASRDEIDRAMEGVPPGSDGLCFWPLLTPSAETARDLAGGGRIAGITLAHSPRHLIRAVVEGLVCELMRHLGRLVDAGLPIRRMILCGEAARSRVTPQIIADVTRRPVACVTEPAVSALGAAVVARALADPGEPLAALATRLAPLCRTVEPGGDAAVYQQLLERYLEPFSSKRTPRRSRRG